MTHAGQKLYQADRVNMSAVIEYDMLATLPRADGSAAARQAEDGDMDRRERE